MFRKTEGLFILGVFKHRLFSQERKFNLRKIFGFGWTPCIGPVLAVILFWSAQVRSVFKGTMLLVAYGVGLGLPFLIVAAGFEKIIPLLKKYAKISQYVSYLSGGFQAMSFYIINLFGLKSLSV